MKEKILLIDGMNFINRANISFGKPKEGGFPVTFIFFRSLRSIIEELSPTKVFFCLEGKNVFRYGLFPEYKGNRIKIASKEKISFNEERDLIIDLLKHLPLKIVSADGFECDDVIATLCEDLKEEEDVTILSNDSDFIQLLQKGNDNIKIYNPFKKQYVSVPEYHYLTFKSLTGDKSDNIPGLTGPKTAIKLSKDIKKFAEFLDNEENRSRYSLNKELIELRMVPHDKMEFKDHDINFNLLKNKFNEMELKTIIEEKYWDRFCKTFADIK